jgi:capsular polysaccharide biosynthesis protein
VRSSLSARNPKHPRRRLYVSRKGASRNVINERELYKALEPLGFEYVEPGSLPFPEQVQVFTQAQVAVGSHGANFVNGIFSPHMTVVEFFQPAHVNWSMWGTSIGTSCASPYAGSVGAASTTCASR